MKQLTTKQEKTNTPQAIVFTNLPTAIGNIQMRPDQSTEVVEEITGRLANGEFHVETPYQFPFGCIDGRSDPNVMNTKPSSAGGSLSFFVADDLTHKIHTSNCLTTFASFKSILDLLKNAEVRAGFHTDTHATSNTSGCGANDHLSTIYRYIANNGATLQAMAKTYLDYQITDTDMKLIASNASQQHQFSPSRELLDLANSRDEVLVDKLEGQHNEVVAVINLLKNTTLDRNQLKFRYNGYQVFNVDAWTFEAMAKLLANNDETKTQSIISALICFNLSALNILAGQEMKIVVLKSTENC